MKAVRDRNISIDITKLGLAILIFHMHNQIFVDSGWLASINSVVHTIANIGVPFFFVCSGYFLFLKLGGVHDDGERRKLIGSYIKKILVMYVGWSVIYLPINLITYWSDGTGILPSVIDYIQHFVFSGSYFHLWYMSGLIVGTLLVYALVFMFKDNFKCVLAFTVCIYVVGAVLSSYRFIAISPLYDIFPWLHSFLKMCQSVILTTQNGFFFGSAFIAMGAYFATSKVCINKFCCTAGLCISIILMLIEKYVIYAFRFGTSNYYYITLLPCAFFLFCLTQQNDCNMTFNGKRIRDIATLLYFIGPFMNFFSWKIVRLFGSNGSNGTIVSYSFIVSFVLTTAAIVVFLKMKNKWRIESYLF